VPRLLRAAGRRRGLSPEPVPGAARTATVVLATGLAIAACAGPEPEPRAEPGPGPDAETRSDLSPSFACDAPGLGEVELRICADPELAALDRRLDSVWQAVVALAEANDVQGFDAERAEQRGWIGGRDECWKASGERRFSGLDGDEAIRRCIVESYASRTARLEVRWRLVDATSGPVFWTCGGDLGGEFVTTWFATSPEAVEVDLGDVAEVFVRTPTASGTRYDGTFGRWFWAKGDSATFVWPQTDTLGCVARSP
jgi:uncharacterized protein YecT (DUF1311 family)